MEILNIIWQSSKFSQTGTSCVSRLNDRNELYVIPLIITALLSTLPFPLSSAADSPTATLIIKHAEKSGIRRTSLHAQFIYMIKIFIFAAQKTVYAITQLVKKNLHPD